MDTELEKYDVEGLKREIRWRVYWFGWEMHVRRVNRMMEGIDRAVSLIYKR